MDPTNQADLQSWLQAHALTVKDGRGLSMAFQPIPAGRGRIGSHRDDWEEPPQWVEMQSVDPSQDLPAYWMGRTPVTQEQMAAWTSSKHYANWREENRELDGNDKSHSNDHEGDPSLPAERVTWFEARAYCEWLKQVGSIKGGPCSDMSLTFALPGEVEWEYACRAGSLTEYAGGDGEASLESLGWYSANSDGTRPVGKKNPNDWGLFDMHGNVWEWCRDPRGDRSHAKANWKEKPDRTVDWKGDSAGDRALRGGSWFNSARNCRSAIRVGGGPGVRGWIQGFRVCLLPGPQFRLPRQE